ncbi:MAG: hypothetical protein ACYSTL_01420, partial [Planctomycetota bacterium]
FATIAGYGPFQSPAHAHLLGFRIFGTNRNWERLIRTNHLLSLYNVRYIIAASPMHRDVIESVRIPSSPLRTSGPNLLTNQWRLKRAKFEQGYLSLRTPFLWSLSAATQPIALQPNTIYRIALDARGPQGGSANFLRAEVFESGPSHQRDSLGLTVFSEQIGAEWRGFEWTFRTPDDLPSKTVFRVFTMSERPIEVRDVSLRTSDYERPIIFNETLDPGERVYRRLTELSPRRAGDPPVAIYENLLCGSGAVGRGRIADSKSIERLKWYGRVLSDGLEEVPELGIPPSGPMGKDAIVLPVAGVLVYGLLGLCAFRGAGKNRKFS